MGRFHSTKAFLGILGAELQPVLHGKGGSLLAEQSCHPERLFEKKKKVLKSRRYVTYIPRQLIKLIMFISIPFIINFENDRRAIKMYERPT